MPSIFIAHRVQHSHFSSIFHRMLLTNALALSANNFFLQEESLRVCALGENSTREIDFSRHEDILPSHRGRRLCCIISYSSTSKYVYKRFITTRYYLEPHLCFVEKLVSLIPSKSPKRQCVSKKGLLILLLDYTTCRLQLRTTVVQHKVLHNNCCSSRYTGQTTVVRQSRSDCPVG